MRNDNLKEREKLEFDLDIKEEDIDPALLERVKNELQWGVVNHPLTIGPLALGAASLAYALAVAPFLGGFLVALPVGVVALLVAGGNAGLRILHVGEKYAIKKLELRKESAQKREEEEKVKIDRSVKFLLTKFAQIDTTKNRRGSRARQELEELVDAYKQVNAEIIQHQASMFTAHVNDRIAPFTKDAYKQGLRVLACVLELLREDPSLDRTTLRREILGLEGELTELRREQDRPQLLKTREKALALRKDRLKKADWRDATIEEFIHQSDECEEVLRATREDLIKLRMEQSEDVLEDMLKRLQECVATLLKVQKEFEQSKVGLSI